MSTRAGIGVLTAAGTTEIRYHHSDSFPKLLVPALQAVFTRDGFEAAAEKILSPGIGWELLTGDTDNPDIVRFAAGDDVVLVPGYGIAFAEDGVGPPMTLADAMGEFGRVYLLAADGAVHYHHEDQVQIVKPGDPLPYDRGY